MSGLICRPCELRPHVGALEGRLCAGAGASQGVQAGRGDQTDSDAVECMVR